VDLTEADFKKMNIPYPDRLNLVDAVSKLPGTLHPSFWCNLIATNTFLKLGAKDKKGQTSKGKTPAKQSSSPGVTSSSMVWMLLMIALIAAIAIYFLVYQSASA
jgi:hypothetical protein